MILKGTKQNEIRKTLTNQKKIRFCLEVEKDHMIASFKEFSGRRNLIKVFFDLLNSENQF